MSVRLGALVLLLLGVVVMSDCDADVAAWDPNDPTIPCCLLEPSLINCHTICDYYAQDWENIPFGTVECIVSDLIDCSGDHSFNLTEQGPCFESEMHGTVENIKTNGYHLHSTVLLTLFGGIFGIDHCFLGNVFLGVLKGILLGGVGIWWIVDVCRLVCCGSHCPDTGCLWEPIY